MGLPKSGTEDTTSNDFKKRFSDDILRIELSGTDHAHLSFVDVPGLFHSNSPSRSINSDWDLASYSQRSDTDATKYQTLDDARIIRQLIERYVKDRRTIIMCVHPISAATLQPAMYERLLVLMILC